MTRNEYDTICAALPGATRSDPSKGEHDTWQVGGKMFALVFHKLPGFAVKTESIEQAAHLIDLGIGTKAPYFHASWLLLPWEVDPDEAQHRIHASYYLIRSKLPKKVQAALGKRSSVPSGPASRPRALGVVCRKQPRSRPHLRRRNRSADPARSRHGYAACSPPPAHAPRWRRCHPR